MFQILKKKLSYSFEHYIIYHFLKHITQRNDDDATLIEDNDIDKVKKENFNKK